MSFSIVLNRWLLHLARCKLCPIFLISMRIVLGGINRVEICRWVNIIELLWGWLMLLLGRYVDLNFTLMACDSGILGHHRWARNCVWRQWSLCKLLISLVGAIFIAAKFLLHGLILVLLLVHLKKLRDEIYAGLGLHLHLLGTPAFGYQDSVVDAPARNSDCCFPFWWWQKRVQFSLPYIESATRFKIWIKLQLHLWTLCINYFTTKICTKAIDYVPKI